MEIYFCPNWLLRRLPLLPDQQVHVGYMLSSVAVVLFVYAAPWIPHRCLIQACFHLPCPGCGMTHALRALLSGAWKESLHYNPAGLLLALCLAFQLLARPFALLNLTSSAWIQRGSRALGTIACGTVLTHWVFQLFI